MTFAQKLRELREAKGWSEARLAKESGVSFSSIHNYVMERRKPSFANVLKIARALGTTCEAFAGCEDLQDEAEAPKGRPRKAAAPGRPAKGKKGGGKG